MDTFKQISVQKAHEIIESSKATIVDIRDADSYAQAHIEQALNINDANIKSFLEGSDKEIPLICYCYHGISSQRAASYFCNEGFKVVYSIEGGYEGWKNAYA